MRIECFDPVADPGKLQACYELYAAGLPADDPGGPLMTRRAWSGWFSLGWTGATPREAWLVPGGTGRTVQGACLLELPDMENRHIATLTILVGPGHRRAGLGTALLRHAAGLRRGDGCPGLRHRRAACA